MKQSELERVCENMKDLEFWEQFKLFQYAQPAAFVSALITDSSRRQRTIKMISNNIKRFCEIFREAGVQFIDRKIILSCKRLVNNIDSLKLPSSKDKAV